MENKPINNIPQLQFDLLKLAKFGNLVGEEVVNDLLTHRDLWHAVLTTGNEFVMLRDINRNSQRPLWNADRVLIITTGKDDDVLFGLAEKWQATEYDFISENEEDEEEAKNVGIYNLFPTSKIIEIWWD